jgi:hypothetical protein
MEFQIEESWPDPWERTYAKLLGVIVYLVLIAVGYAIGSSLADAVREGQFWNGTRKYAPLIAILLVYMVISGLWKDGIARWRSRSRLNEAILHTISAAVPICYLNYLRGDHWWESAFFVLCSLGVFWFAAGLEAEWPAPGRRSAQPTPQNRSTNPRSGCCKVSND